ncbi:FtsK/SpoIIIE domain-containing protein [Schumannella sp. 10F1B-5-1]|uniref:FtsK/SpoIIIE domain-containing protein n=1 Tax=Schumannella sp. 10F1B-5-1 TaxID=2590780 RepID=UPI0011318400|nr:FtsK/SpoIIIE domain-containing protein [Schumannella sp. 10F1B-5-1]TPW72261.1 FHA domain-containing protein [Schumannella sp. 10F1B-5-1]
MRLKLTLRRDSGSSDDIVITTDAAATIAEVAGAIRRVDPSSPGPAEPGSLTLSAVLPGSSQALVLPPDGPVGESWIGSGATVQLVDAGRYFSPASVGRGHTVARITMLTGSQSGKVVELQAGTTVVGRDPGCDLVIDDPLVSKRHLRLEADAAVELVDLGSANGVEVDGGIVTRLRIEKSETVTIGDTAMRIDVDQEVAELGGAPTAGPVYFNRSPAVEPRYPGQEFPGPEVPKEGDGQPFPFLSMVAPLGMGVGLYIVTRNPQSLLFVAMSPLLMIGNYITQALNRRRKKRQSIEKFDGHLEKLTESLAEEKVTEHERRHREAPSTEEVLDASLHRDTLLWTRRPEHWSFLNVRLGVGRMLSRNSIQSKSEGNDTLPDYQERFDEVAGENRHVEQVPLVDNLHDSGAIGIAGPNAQVVGAANALLVQLTGLHSPAELAIAALITPAWSNGFDWLKWMPHTSSPHSPIQGSHLADSASSGAALISAIEELVTRRLAAQKGDAGRRGATTEEQTALDRGAVVGESQTSAGTRSPIPALVLLISDDVAVDRARLVQLAEQAADAGVYPIWLASEQKDLPAVCRTFLSLPVPGTTVMAPKPEEKAERPPVGSKAARKLSKKKAKERKAEAKRRKKGLPPLPQPEVEMIPTLATPTVGFVRLGDTIENVLVDFVEPDRALDYARRLAPVIDAGALVADASDLPRSISLITLLGHELVETSEAVIDRWRQNESMHDRTPGIQPKRRKAGKLRAIVGSAGVDAMHLDLRTQGPHALVGGTTGAGKSEFLQGWVLGMAAEYSPDRVTFLFVDYKGGSAFADCVSLPHCVGLVTDLSPHLVRRALTSLRAELHHREHLLNRKKAKDLLELEKRGDPDSPPALVLVIDEFAALAGEVPEFVDGVVDIAQRGRSLGIHLIMATQRPAGVIKDNLRANTNMRVALRMADESDSQDVVGIKEAAHFDPGIPGRGVAKTGPGRLAQFQSAYAGGWTSREPEAAEVQVSELRFGGEIRWEEPRSDAPSEEKDLGPTDQQRLVASIIKAASGAQLPAPRRPWLDELASVYDLGRLRQRTDAELLLGVSDMPQAQRQSPVYFLPDVDGHLSILGTGGTGKSAVLRTLAGAAAITPRGGPVQVYGLDFGAGSLRMLEQLPHVGAIINGDDTERVIRLFRRLKEELESRAPRFAEANASSIAEYRGLTGRTQEPRILLLIDGFPNFREDFEIPAGRSQWYSVFEDILSDGRQLGMHVALTADRPGAVPTAVGSNIQRRVVLRLADDSYGMVDAPSDVLSTASPAGRAIVDGLETQIAILGGSRVVAEQSTATRMLGEAMRRAGVPEAPGVGSLPKEYVQSTLPDQLGGQPVIGLSDVDLGPWGFEPVGTLLLAGPPASGRSTALETIAQAIGRAEPETRLYYMGNTRSNVGRSREWVDAATTPEKVAELAKLLVDAVTDPDTEGRIAVVVESIGDFLQTPADSPLVELIRAIKRSDHFLLAEGETSSWSSSWPLLGEVKNARRGLLLQPEAVEGDILLKTALPRMNRSEFPPGRGVLIAKGKAVRIQLPLVG